MKTIQEIAEFCCDNPNLDDIFEEITKISAEATRLERERCLKAIEDAWEEHIENILDWNMDRSYHFKVEIIEKISAGE